MKYSGFDSGFKALGRPCDFKAPLRHQYLSHIKKACITFSSRLNGWLALGITFFMYLSIFWLFSFLGMRVKTKFWITLGTDAVMQWVGRMDRMGFIVHQEFGSSLNPGTPVAMWTCPLQVLAATLILSQPGGHSVLN